jgi:putative intracellular protease/amidase
MWKEGKVVSAICHGPAALVNVKDANGKPIVSGRKVTCFSNTEEEQVKLTEQIPFLVETKLKEVCLSLTSKS